MIPKTLIEDLKRNSKWLTVDAVINILEDFQPTQEPQAEPTSQQKKLLTEQEITEAVNAMKF